LLEGEPTRTGIWEGVWEEERKEGERKKKKKRACSPMRKKKNITVTLKNKDSHKENS